MQRLLKSRSDLEFYKPEKNTNMLNRALILALSLVISASSFAQSKKEMKQAKEAYTQNPIPYVIYDSTGTAATFNDIVRDAMNADVVLFGELHNNPIVHWLQLVLTEEVGSKTNNLVLGAEMLERDDQLPLNEYLSDVISYSKLETNARLWPNFETDYLPLVEYAKENNHPFIATNVPRRYASFVYKHGLDTLQHLSAEAKSYLPTLPIEFDINLESYQEMLEMAGGHGGENLPKAQAIKDATMADAILKNLPNDGIFIHYHGAFHSQKYEGIVWYLLQQNPKLKIITINAAEQDSIIPLGEESLNIADYTIVTPTNLTKTH